MSYGSYHTKESRAIATEVNRLIGLRRSLFRAITFNAKLCKKYDKRIVVLTQKRNQLMAKARFDALPAGVRTRYKTLDNYIKITTERKQKRAEWLLP